MPQLNKLMQRYFFAFALLSPLVLAQSIDNPPVPDEQQPWYQLHSLLLKVRRSNYDPLISAQATPALREAFSNSTDSLTKENVASVLMIIGQKDDVYWATLSKRAQEIVDSQAPDPLLYDAEGKSVRGVISPEFLQWAKDNNIPRDQAVNEHLGLFSVELSMMAMTGDSRGLPILRKGLASPNYGVRATAAQGLALLQDHDSISQIIDNARQAPSEIQSYLAQPLILFNDPKAQAAADELITDKKLLEDLRQRANAKGPRGLW